MFARQNPILITSDPVGASFKTSDGQRGVTPVAITPVNFKKKLTVTYELEGHETAVLESKPRTSWWIVANGLWGLTGLIGIGIDLANEGAWVFPDANLHGILMPIEGGAD
jgi:hypothetical protein